jgi:2-polyprenyl-3-methyl-5-hydroxy-6-metoxy-1,4-benzoquinol methylase
MNREFWDERYGAEAYAYGDKPNDFVVEVAPELPRGRVLCLAAGEGRNAAWLAGLMGMGPVTAVDMSAAGLKKAAALANERGVSLDTVQATLGYADFATLGISGPWDVITAIWAHVPPEVRSGMFAEVVRHLAPGGVLVVESYTPDQCGRGTGGPPVPGPTMTLAQLERDLAGLELLIGRELERAVHEGPYHDGMSAVVQVLARKPHA